MPRTSRLLAAIGSGVAIFASFPPLDWWWAAPIGVAGLILAVRGTTKRSSMLLGYLHGVAFLLCLFSYVRVFGPGAWLVLAGGEAVFFAVLGLMLRTLTGFRGWPVSCAGGWLVVEAIRDRQPFGGLPWGRLADAQAGGPIAHLASIGGAPLVSFAVALAGGLLAGAAVTWPTIRHGIGAFRWTAGVGLAGAAVGVSLIGGAIALPTAGTTTHGPASAVVALVQGNVPRLGLTAFAQRYAVTQNEELQTFKLADLVSRGRLIQPQLVLWPEDSSDNDPTTDARAYEMIQDAVSAIGVPMLVGEVLNGPGDKVRNAGVVWSPTDGPGQIYVKQHLLPFGEYLPFRSILSRYVGEFRHLLPRDFAPGTGSRTLQIGPVRAADAICFEIADDGIVRDEVRDGGRVIIAQTNDASYEHIGDSGRGGESAQQLQISRLRAIEHGRSVLVVSTSGLSAVVTPNGSVALKSRIFTPAILEARVALRDPETIADKVGSWPEWAIVLLTLGWLVGALIGRRKLSPQAPEPAAGAFQSAAIPVPTERSPAPAATVTAPGSASEG